jgi:lipid-A-disaccharide synthase-like uncharacterized protein
MARIACLLLAALLLIHASTAWAEDVDILDSGDLPAVEITNKPHNATRVDLAMRDASYAYHVQWDDGSVEWLTPEAYARVLYRDDVGRPWWKRVLNITTPMGMIWVGLGLLGQVLFTGRMIVQWLVSEREKRSTVPPMFWWMSIIGATMLIVYFAWRKDIVGAGGQMTGWFIYVRNLRMIYSRKYGRAAEADPSNNATPTVG